MNCLIKKKHKWQIKVFLEKKHRWQIKFSLKPFICTNSKLMHALMFRLLESYRMRSKTAKTGQLYIQGFNPILKHSVHPKCEWSPNEVEQAQTEGMHKEAKIMRIAVFMLASSILTTISSSAHHSFKGQICQPLSYYTHFAGGSLS